MKLRILIVVGILVVVSAIVLVLVFTLGGIQSNGCTESNKPSCTHGILHCKDSLWRCECGGHSYQEAINLGLTIPCRNPAIPTCNNNEWSCLCNTESGSVSDQKECETDQNGSYVCDNGQWHCRCNGTNLQDRKSQEMECNRYNGLYKCGDKVWQCVSPNSVTGSDDVLNSNQCRSHGSGAHPYATDNGWVCQCGGIPYNGPCNKDALSCNDSGQWECACDESNIPTCLGGTTCSTESKEWECKCGNESLEQYVIESQCTNRNGNISCNNTNQQYQCSCVLENGTMMSLKDCKDGTGFCADNKVQCCFSGNNWGPSDWADYFEKIYQELFEELTEEEQTLLNYNNNIYQMINNDDSAIMEQIQQKFVRKLMDNLPTEFIDSSEALFRNIQECADFPVENESLCRMFQILSKLKLVKLNNLESVCSNKQL